MTPEEVEALLRRVPELQTPPGLDSRVLRHSPPRRFPAATAIAASLLFCLGIFWLVVAAPGKQPVLQDDGVRIRIEHEGDGDPARCTDLRHWKHQPAGFDGIRPDRRVVVHAAATAPWGAVRQVLDGCAQAGLYQVEWSTPASDALKVWLPEPPPSRGPEKVFLEQIRISLSRKPGREETVRNVGNRAESPTIDDLMHIVLMMVADYGKAGKTEAPIHLDPGADVPWKDVIQIVDICRKERLGPVEFVPPLHRRAPAADPSPAGSGPRTPVQSDETMFADLQRELSAGKLGDGIKVLIDMITRHPDSSYTVRGYTRVKSRLDGAEDPTPAYRKKWLALAPAVYDALLKPRRLVDGRGMLDVNALGKTPEEMTESLYLYMEQGYLQRELAVNGQKFQFDNASTVFSNVLRVVTPQTEIWWVCKYEVLATLVERGAGADVKLARVGLENIERSYPEFDEAKYGQKERFLKLKEKIGELLKPK